MLMLVEAKVKGVEFVEEGDAFIATNSNCDGNHANEFSIHERKWLQLLTCITSYLRQL
jgi:hypothetical protein